VEGEVLPQDLARGDRAERGFVGRVADWLSVLLTCAIVAWALDLYRAAGLVLYTEQFLAAMLGIATPLVFLHFPLRGRGRAGPAPWYDLLAAGLSFVCCVYIVVRYPVLSTRVAVHPADGLVVAAILLLLLLEGLRRTSGWAIVWTAVGFIALALLGHLLPPVFSGREISPPMLTFYMIWDVTAVLGPTLEIVVAVVVAYLLFGNVLFRSGGSRFFTGLSMALMGRYRGGPAKIAIMGSSLFGMISGSVVSNVATVGVVTIPLMKEGGYKPYHAAAIEACASTGGQLMPPVMGIAAFIMAEYLEVPYREVAISAIIPSLLYYGGLFIQADLEAVRSGITRVEESRIPQLLRVLKDGWFFAIPFAVLIAMLFWLNHAPETAAIAATAVILAAAFAFRFEGTRLTLPEFVEMLRVTAISSLDLFMIAATAGMLIGALNISGLGFGLSLSLVNMAGGDVVLLLVLAAVVCTILGLGMPTVAVYILLATLVAPALVQMKISPMAAHMFIMYYGILSVITPPVAIAAYAAANMAGADQWKTGWEAMRFGWTAFVIPFVFVFNDTLLFFGSAGEIAVDFALAVAGVWFVCAGVMGWSFAAMGAAKRLYYAVVGLATLVPAADIMGNRWLNFAAAAAAAATLAGEYALVRRARAAAPSA
jgi:TRAP transporter 4TM/12TM fusion protein